MEKIRSIRTVLAFSLVFLLAGCSGKQDGAMTIQKAELTEKEQQTVALIETGRSVKLYDYKTEPGISSLLFSVETLNEQGQWETVASSVFSQSGQEDDRVAILFSDDSITFSCGEGRYEVMLGSSHYKNTADSWLTETSPIRTDEKIPLGIVAYTDSDSVIFPNTDDYEEPEKLSGRQYKEVKAVTLQFSGETLPGSENERNTP